MVGGSIAGNCFKNGNFWMFFIDVIELVKIDAFMS